MKGFFFLSRSKRKSDKVKEARKSEALHKSDDGGRDKKYPNGGSKENLLRDRRYSNQQNNLRRL